MFHIEPLELGDVGDDRSHDRVEGDEGFDELVLFVLPEVGREVMGESPLIPAKLEEVQA